MDPDKKYAVSLGALDAASDELPRPISPNDDPELAGKSLFEKKCVLLNREMDSNGMGKYQWWIWLLCSQGYFLDLMYAQAFGLVLAPLEQELGFATNESGNISIAFSSGLTAGAFVWGFLVDIIGRRWAFNFTCLFTAVFGLALGGCNTYTQFLVVTAFVGFGIGGNIPIDTTICLEFIPQNKRFLLALLSIWQPIGVAFCCAIAYAFIPRYSCYPNSSSPDALVSCNSSEAVPGQPCCDRASNMGWRYLMFTLGAIALFIFFVRFVVFNFKESPKYLVYRGQDAKAIEVLEHVAKVNKRQCSLTKSHLDALSSDNDSIGSGAKLLGSGEAQLEMPFADRAVLELSRYKLLFDGWQMTRLTVLVWLTYIGDYWAFTLAGGFLPRIVQAKNSELGSDTLEFTYRSYLAIYTPGIVGVVLGSMMYNVSRFGRKWTMAISAGLMAASMFIFSAVNTKASNIGLNMMEYFFQSMFNAVLYGWTPEVFPAPIRGTACGLASFWGRLFGIIAPISANSLLPTGDVPGSDPAWNRILYLAGGIGFGCVLTILLLPSKKMGQQSF